MKSEPVWDAADYSVSSSAQLDWGRQLLEKLELSGSEDVLDIGCGDGKLTAMIAERVPRGNVIGIDSSESMIDHASEKHANGADNLSFQQVDARELSFEDRFDAVFSNAALHWIHDHGPVLRGIYRALRPGGRILLQMGGKGNASEIKESLNELTCSSRWSKYFNDFNSAHRFHGPEEYDDWLIAAGLRPNRVELLTRDMQHDRNGFESWIRTTWLPYTQRVPESLREEFIGECVAHHLERIPPDGDGIVHTQMKRLEVEAVKSDI